MAAMAAALSPEFRKAALARAIQTQITPDMRIESQSNYQAVLVFGRRPNHLLHFFIGFLTIGVWWIVWLVLALTNSEKRRMITVTEDGRIETRDFQR